MNNQNANPNTKTKQRQLIILFSLLALVVGAVVVGMFAMDAPATGSTEKPRTVSITSPGTIDDLESWRAKESARAQANETMLAELNAKLQAQEETNQRLSQDLKGLKEAASKESTAKQGARTARHQALSTARDVVINSVLERPLPVQTSSQGALPPPTATASLNQPLNASAQPASTPEAVEMISFAPLSEQAKSQLDARSNANADSKTSSKTAIEFIPAGSFVRVAMLNGVDAPTGGQSQSNPLPVAFHVLSTANLANKYKLDIKDCRFIAAAWGDLSSERTMARTESLTCIINGETVEMSVKGQAMGEDGKVGIRGRVVTKQGQLLANALFAGSLSGIGSAFQAAATTSTSGAGGITQTIDGSKVAQAAIGGGVGSAASMLARYYLKAADKLFPVIETDGGRVVEILITKGAVYQGNAASREQYRALLKRNGSSSRSHTRRNSDG